MGSRAVVAVGLVGTCLASSKAVGAEPERFAAAWGVSADRYDKKLSTSVDDLSRLVQVSQTDTIAVAQVASSVPANILWPGEKAKVTIQITNKTHSPVRTTGKVDVIRYCLYTLPLERDDAMFHVGMRKLADEGSVPVQVDIAPGGYQHIEISPPIPETFGGYALILDLKGQERLFAAGLIRTYKNPHPGDASRLRMDINDVDVLLRLGAVPNRIGMAFRAKSDPDYETYYQRWATKLREFQAAKLPVCIEFGHETPMYGPHQPLGRPRTHLRDELGKPVATDYPGDIAWLPSYDPAFKAWVKRIALEFGWPKGPVNAMKLWNEPWEGGSIAWWGADMLRYREIYTALCEAVEEARKEAGVKILLGGADSSSNTMDKHFPDGNDERFLAWTDFMSIHYQGMSPAAGIRKLVDRKHPNGRTLVWDTESWCANSDERVASIIPTMYATGHDAVVGIHSQHVVSPATEVEVRTPGGVERRRIVQALSVGAAVGALQHFIGNRTFERILFRGLPLVYVFRNQSDEEDGTLVLCADLAPVFGLGVAPFRTVKCLEEIERKRDLHAKLATLAPGSLERLEAEKTWRTREPFTGARFIIDDPGGRFRLYDCYGNPVPAQGKKIVVPVNADGWYLRGDGRRGSFAALLSAVEAGRLEGMQPFEIIAHDPTAPIEARPTVKLELRNILSRPVRAVLSVSLGALRVEAPHEIKLGPREAKTIELRIVGGEADPSNMYALSVRLDAGADGLALHDEVLRCNVIARRHITVDGKLDEWKGVLPQTVFGDGSISSNVQAAAWWPNRPFPTGVKKGLASVFLAYDEKALYVAAKVADDSPDKGTFRMATRDDDQFFYPETVWFKDKRTGKLEELRWPAGVRRYSYRCYPVLPSGNAPDFDNLQIGFNVLPDDEKPWYPAAPGTWKGFADYWTTDYEFALNKVAEEFGGGTEIWRLRYPGMPDKHFYPRQPKSPVEGPAQGKLVIRYEGGMRLVECSLPWTEIPGVKRCLDAGQTIKFSFRVNDDAGVGCMELARWRSVSRRSYPAFKVDWLEHWANEVEFGFER